MIKTAQELKEQAGKLGITKYPVHECSMCGYPCGFIIEGDTVLYDNGCGCVMHPPRSSSWEELAHTYNRNQPENNPKIKQSFLKKLNQTWRFPPHIKKED